jgi:hypothetical protein
LRVFRNGQQLEVRLKRRLRALAASWRGSFSANGTPGEDEGTIPFAQWMTDRGTTDPLSLAPDSGFSNLLTFALGADLLANPPSAAPLGSIDNGDGTETVTIRAPTPITSEARTFLRLHVAPL